MTINLGLKYHAVGVILLRNANMRQCPISWDMETDLNATGNIRFFDFRFVRSRAAQALSYSKSLGASTSWIGVAPRESDDPK